MATIWALAGTNGAGKSSVAGALLRQSGGDYFNPDELARRLRERRPSLRPEQANAQAWAAGLALLDAAIAGRKDFFFETTLGGNTIAGRLEKALEEGLSVRIWYVGLASPELHLARVAARMEKGGHPIPEADVRRRYDASRRNLIRLLPRLNELRVFDNSAEGDPDQGGTPSPVEILHWQHGEIVAMADPAQVPEWTKAIVAAALRAGRP